MKKAYWVSVYHQIYDNEKLAAYGKIAAPAVIAAGGKFIVRNLPVRVFEAGIMQRVTIVEFESLEKAIAARETQEYKTALTVLDDGVRRDFRIVDGLD